MSETTITIPFEITGWDEDVYDEPAEGPKLTQAVVRKRYTGELEATSVARLLTAQGDGGRGYLASERVEGTLQGRRGTFVLQHGGVDGDGDLRQFGFVVAGSGTGELAGLRGTALFAHHEDGARLRLSFSL